MTAAPTQAPHPTDDLPGLLSRLDQDLFAWFLNRDQQPGDLLELGAHQGQTALLIGEALRPGERFTVHDPSDPLAPGSCRFAHLDPSHLDPADHYAQVRADLATVRTVLRPGGIMVCNDYRSEHTPGIAAALWEAVVRDDLHPICVSPQRLYATWDDPALLHRELVDHLAAEGTHYEIQQVMAAPLIRIDRPRPPVPRRTMKTALEREQEKHLRTKDALRRKRDQLDDVQRSVSYRVGRMITAPPRAIRRMPRGPGPSV